MNRYTGSRFDGVMSELKMYHKGLTRLERFKLWFFKHRMSVGSIRGKYFSGFMQFRGDKDYFEITLEARADDNVETGNLVSGSNFSLRWEEVKDLVCSACHRVIPTDEWSSIKATLERKKPKVIERHCIGCKERKIER